ncbi:MAG: flagellar biosynthesis repressor FlbT [Hyphococcus sp.]|nr:MAG: flagellar biosynthesis repressor FlbT [Marinicaulis sp.]
MAGLILKLRPREQLMINGVIIENGDAKAKLLIKTENANILRMRDAMKPEEATTPLKRAYYVIQLAVGGQLPPPQAKLLVEHTLQHYPGQGAEQLYQTVNKFIVQDDFYKAMRFLGEKITEDETVDTAHNAVFHEESFDQPARRERMAAQR